MSQLISIVRDGTSHDVCQLSVVIPAYNEEKRIAPYLNQIRDYFSDSYDVPYEVFVVDDGSNDQTVSLISEIASFWPELKLLRHPHNLGKGAAVRTGFASARGELILFADADGATPFAEEKSLRCAIESGADIAVGSRQLPDGSGKSCRRKISRRLGGKVFSYAVRTFFDIPVKDTQCGFKMFRGSVGRQILEDCGSDGYLLDIEILARATNAGLTVREIGVDWNEVPGSRISFLRDSFVMYRGLKTLKEWLKSEGIVS